MGGSYFIETLTRQMMDDARKYFDQIEQKGGMIEALEAGFFRREIADAAFVYQREIDARHKLIVGVNAFVEKDEKPLDTLQIDHTVEAEQIDRVKKLKSSRDAGAVARALGDIKRLAATDTNLMPLLLDAADARCTVGEIMNALAEVFGRYDGAARW
jgi:methylmalonyl-CoA mutase N-terminal domain/subunit